jgi:hypothetical protein
MASRPDLDALALYIAQLEAQIGEQKLLVDVLLELGDAAEAGKAAARLGHLEESYGAVILYRDLLQEELNKKTCIH